MLDSGSSSDEDDEKKKEKEKKDEEDDEDETGKKKKKKSASRDASDDEGGKKSGSRPDTPTQVHTTPASVLGSPSHWPRTGDAILPPCLLPPAAPQDADRQDKAAKRKAMVDNLLDPNAQVCGCLGVADLGSRSPRPRSPGWNSSARQGLVRRSQVTLSVWWIVTLVNYIFLSR